MTISPKRCKYLKKKKQLGILRLKSTKTTMKNLLGRCNGTFEESEKKSLMRIKAGQY